MLRYALRRILYMLPTVFGVIVITFILFNIVGGSPAAMTLGKNVSPQALEEFDEQRGFNKPLFFGGWTTTRAWPDAAARGGTPPWKAGEGVVVSAGDAAGPARVTLAGPAEHAVPFLFRLRADAAYRWEFRYRSAEPAALVVQAADGGGAPRRVPLPASESWRRAAVTFRPDAAHRAAPLAVSVPAAGMEIRDARLRRATAHALDSQFVYYLRQLARLDFGTSSATNQRVSHMLLAGLVPSLLVTVPIFFGSLAVSISIALLCAFFRNRLIDRVFVFLSIALMSVNYIVWIVAGQYLLAYKAGLFPIWGFESWRFLVLPWIVGIVSGLGGNIRFYRTIMLDEMYKDYVRTAFAKGVGLPGVLFRHVLKNAMIPILTNVVMAIPFLYAGSLLLESFFGIPGLGYIGVNAINSSDVDVVRAVVLIGAVIYVAANLLTDVCYALADPRVRLR